MEISAACMPLAAADVHTLHFLYISLSNMYYIYDVYYDVCTTLWCSTASSATVTEYVVFLVAIGMMGLMFAATLHVLRLSQV